MKTRLDIVRNGRISDEQVFNSVLKRWQQRFGYWSIFAAVPAVLVSQLPLTRAVEGKQTEEKPTGLNAPHPRKWSVNESTRSLLKRQSQFRLPSGKTDDVSLRPLAGPDDCPGRGIPAGTFTAMAPYSEVNDTTGANNTISSFYMYSFGYQTVDSPGPDHVYSFILTERGANPKIEISTTSPTFSPVIYLLEGGFPEACGGDANRFAWNGLMYAESANGGATINSQLMNWLPLNVPLYLFIDSRDQSAGSYTLRMQDVTIAPPVSNAIDDPGFFVRQHYLDFLGRYPDPDGQRFWVNEITSCGGNQACIDVKRINDSGAFFLSIEFQETGYLLYRTYQAAYGNLPNAPVPIKLYEFWEDKWKLQGGVIVNQSGWQQQLETNKQRFFTDFVRKSRFISAYSGSLSPSEFVDRLFSNCGVTPTSGERQAVINEFGSAPFASDDSARARALRRVAENPTLAAQEFNRAFVLMQYFGYLLRNPDDAPDNNFVGYNFWLDKLNQFNGDFIAAEMVKAFLTSTEYRRRFGPE
jgi:hypothetical protein